MIMAISTDPGVWAGAIMTILVYTFFIRTRPNILFKFAESTVVGIALGYIIVIVMAKNINSLALTKIAEGNIILIIPILLGLLVYTRFSSTYRYLARIPIAFIVGTGMAVAAYGVISSGIIRNNLNAVAGYIALGSEPIKALANVFNILALLTSIFYFYFTLGKRSNQAPYSWLIRYGRYSMMLYFGIAFGNVVMSRISLFIGRMMYLLYDWIGIVV
jgi:hypothetical protein